MCMCVCVNPIERGDKEEKKTAKIRLNWILKGVESQNGKAKNSIEMTNEKKLPKFSRGRGEEEAT